MVSLMVSKNLKKIKDKITEQNIIIGNPTFVIKDLINTINSIEQEILKMKKDIKKLQEVTK